jgi:hypothetical protein
MSDDEFSGVGLSNGGDGTGRRSRGGKHRGPRFTWNPAYEQTFFRSLCESVRLGLREGTTFKPEAWDRAAQALIDQHNAYANKSHLINKSDNARKKFRLWRSLREDPEFMYDPSTKTVTGTEEMWRRHIEVRRVQKCFFVARKLTMGDHRKSLCPDRCAGGHSSTKSSTRSCSPTSLDLAAHRSE